MKSSIVIPPGKKKSDILDITESCELLVTVQAHAESFLLIRTRGNMPINVTQRCSIGEGGRLHLFLMTLGKDVEYSLVSECNGQNASCTIDWIFHASGNDQLKLSAKNIFNAPNGGGEITIKGIAENNGKVQCNGMIEIGEKGKGTETYLTENVLMLDKTAHVDAIPRLEIRTNDVKASHSATISKITEEHLFYLQSRGIREHDARQMFVQGFLGDLLEKIEDQELREAIRHSLSGDARSIALPIN